MLVLKGLFWGSLGALARTHVGYPAVAEIAARLRPRPVRKDETAILAACSEESVSNGGPRTGPHDR